MSDLLLSYRDYLTTEKKASANTVSSYLRDVHQFEEAMDSKGIPLTQVLARDVEDYIRLEGRGCLLVGYWKVYHNVRRAKRTFAAFDEAREQTVREVLEGKELHQLCN